MNALIAATATTVIVIFACLSFYYFLAPRIVTIRLGRKLGKVFASYSRKDTRQVELIGQVTKGLGGQFIYDQTHILGGEDWQEKLHQLIRESDTFQLFWSRNASESSQVENEWKYALGLKRRKNFIRPIYWEEGLTIPRELAHVQFTFIDLDLNYGKAAIPPSLRTLVSMPTSFIILFIVTLTIMGAALFWGVRAVIDRPRNSGSQPEQQQNAKPSVSQSIETPLPPVTDTPVPSPNAKRPPVPTETPRIDSVEFTSAGPDCDARCFWSDIRWGNGLRMGTVRGSNLRGGTPLIHEADAMGLIQVKTTHGSGETALYFSFKLTHPVPLHTHLRLMVAKLGDGKTVVSNQFEFVIVY